MKACCPPWDFGWSGMNVGMSLREDVFDVIGNDAHFAAHYFVE